MNKENLINFLEQIYKVCPEKMVVKTAHGEEEASDYIKGYLYGYKSSLGAVIDLIRHLS